ncbi:MAG: DUF4112 domain-containing protein [Salinisphaera sp.]|nr:DUF4112 domain-containing protein [Salinisphaera sp.]
MKNQPSHALLERRKASLKRVDRWAHALDEAVRIPGTRFRVGADSIIGLLPGIGDFAGLALGSGLIAEALYARAPKRVWLRMSANTGLDFVVGLIPVLGDVFDVVWQSNSRNAALFRRWLEQETAQAQPQRTSSIPGMVGLAGGLLVAAVAGAAVWHGLTGH